MTIEWNKVTWYSKAAAVILFAAVFGVAFYLGWQYGQIYSGQAASSDEIVQASPSGDATVSTGQTAVFGELSLTLNAVVNDYRCPVDVQCIEAGAINTNVTFSAGGETQTKNMPSDEVPQEFAGYRISITGVSPPAYSGREISQSLYAVTFHFEKI